MIKRGLMITLMASASALAIAPRIALAGGGHLEHAIAETKEGIHERKQGWWMSLVPHAVNAIHHANAAQKERPREQTKTDVTHLKKAIKTAKHTHSSRRVAKAVEHAETAPDSRPPTGCDRGKEGSSVHRNCSRNARRRWRRKWSESPTRPATNYCRRRQSGGRSDDEQSATHPTRRRDRRREGR
jgi:hypothetical protein